MSRIIVCLMAISFLFGCGHSSRSSKPTGITDNGLYLLDQQPEGLIPMQYTERLIALDKYTRDNLLYITHRQGRLPSGQVKITVALQNRSQENNVWISWKAVFYDSKNFLIEETEWQKTYFPLTQIKEITVNSIRKDVDNFTLMLKNADTQEGN